MLDSNESPLPSTTDFFLSIGEVAALIKVSTKTVRRWLSRGLLQGVRTSARGRWRIPRPALSEFLQGAKG